MSTTVKEFKKGKTRFIEAICHQCGVTFTKTKKYYSEKEPCTVCKRSNKIYDYFLQKAKNKFGDKFDLSRVKETYINNNSIINVRCIKHNLWYTIRAKNFVANSYPNAPHNGGCSKCSSEATKEACSKSIEHYLENLNTKFPEISVIKLPKKVTSNTNKITLLCKKHGEFICTLADIIRRNPYNSCMCPKCTKEYFPWQVGMTKTKKESVLYFVYFKKTNLYKLGVTTRSLKKRFQGHLHELKELWKIPFKKIEDAFLVELYMLNLYGNYRIEHPIKSVEGYTEFLTVEIKKPDKRFIEEILCQKKSNSGEALLGNAKGNPERSLDVMFKNVQRLEL